MREKSKKNIKTRLLALLLVFCMTFQMISYSPGNVVRAEGEDSGVSEALDDEGLSLPENITEPSLEDSAEESETVIPEEETPQPTDWTAQTDSLRLTLAGMSYQKGDEEPVDLNAEENKWDLSALNPEEAGRLTFKWQYAFAEGTALNSGDTFSLGMPKNAEGKAVVELKDTEAPVALTDEKDNELGSYEIEDNIVTVTLNETAAGSTEAVSGVLELSGVLNAEALKNGETTDAALAPQGEAGEQWQFTLPGKAAAEPVPEPAPTAKAEQEKENSVMNGLKALFGVQPRTAAQTGPQDVTNNTGDITLEIPYMAYKSPDDVITNFKQDTQSDKTTIDLSGKPYEAGGSYLMELDFTLIDKEGEDNLPSINTGDFFLFKIPKALIAPKTESPVSIMSSTGKEIASYEVKAATADYTDGAKKEDYPFFVKIIFSSVVDDTDLYGISGGFTMNLELNPDGVGNPDGDTINLKPQGNGGHHYEIKLPPIKHKVEGVSKNADYKEYKVGDEYKKEITWNITVGDKTPGADLAGVTITDTLPAELRGSLIKSANNNGSDLTQTEQYQPTNEGFTYTFPQNSTAPQTITVVTAVPESIYTALADKNAVADQDGKVKKDLKNAVELTTNNDYIALEGETKADATATIERPTITKTGEQKSSDLIVWTITVNDTGAGNSRYNIYDAVVTDTMSADLSMDDEMLGKMLIRNLDTNNDIEVEKWDNGEPNPETDKDNYYTYGETGVDGSKELKFYFYGSNDKYERTMSNAVKIEFETKVDSSKYDPSDKPEDQGRKNKNTATLTCDWPYGKGPGPGIEYGLGPIGTDYRDVYVDKTGEADTTTGLITWTIDPATRLIPREGESATITDTIIGADYAVSPKVGKHTFVLNSIKVYDETDGNKAAINDGITINEPGNGSDQFTVTINGETIKKLDDLRIEYQTKADDFFDQPDSVDYKYKNRVDLIFKTENGAKLNTSDDAEVVFPNRFLSKDTEFIPDGAYMKYTILVNENRIPFANNALTVEDDLGQLITHIVDKDGKDRTITGLSDVWTYAFEKTEVMENDGTGDKVSTENISFSNNKLTFTPAEPSGKQYTITLYLKLTKAAKEAYLAKGDCQIYTENKASAKGTYDGKTITQDVTSTGDGAVGTLVNKLADKQHGADSGDILKLNWTIDINPYAATLGKTADASLTVEDTIASGMEFDRASVKLLEKAANGQYTDTNFDKKTITVVENADGGYTMKLNLPQDSTTYRLKYTTNVIGRVSGNVADNYAVLKVGDKTLSESGSSSGIDRNAWGTLQTRTTYKFVKYDSLTGTSKPLAGATFGLYSSSSCEEASLINYYTSNAQGIVKFPALDFSDTAAKSYYYKEIGEPEGYKLPTTSGVEIKKETADSTGQVANSRLNDGTATITKQFDTPSGSNASGQQSEFQLYLYPRDNFGGTRVPVVLTGNDGSYIYDEAGTEAKPADGTFMKNDTNGKLNITSLPWGDYALEEVNPSPGYAAVEGEQRFTVKYDAKAEVGKQWTTEYQFGTSPNKDDGKITNALTKISIKKTADSGKSLKDAKLTICSDADGVNVITSVFSSSQKFEWTISDTDNTWESKDITGLKAGTYYLVETAGPADSTIAMSKPVKFTLDNYGKITAGGNKNTNTVTMSDPTVKIKVAKKDQFGMGVSDAELTITEGVYQNGVFTANNPSVEQKIDKTDGNAQEVTGLERGKTYQLEETNVPAGYMKANPMVFSIDDYGKITVLNNGDQMGEEEAYKNKFDNNQTLTLTDERIVGHVQFKKMDSYLPTGQDKYKPLEGVQFDLYKANGAAPADGDTKINATHFTSDSEGVVTTLNCNINDQTGETLSHGLRPGTYYFKEVATHGDFVLPTGKDANTPTFEVKTDGSNRYSWKNDVKDAADGGKHYIIDITKENQPYSMLNDPFRCDIFFTKTDADEPTKGVVDATYGLYSDAQCKVPVTEKDGSKRTVTTKAKGETNTYTDSNGNVWTHAIENDGEAYFCDVPRSDGLYIKEEIPAPGYTLNTTIIGPIKTSDLTAQQTIKLNEITVGGVTNGKITDKQNKIEIAKIKAADTTGKLSGAKLKLTGKFVDSTDTASDITWTTSSDQFEVFSGRLIADEVYTLTEVTPPAGYEKAADVKLKVDAFGKLSASTDGGTNWQEVDNNQYQLSDNPVEISFDKKDQFSQPVNGAELAIYKLNASNNPEGDAIETWTTDQNSHKVSAKLSVGQKYRLTEENTPAGYTTATAIDFTITDDGKISNQNGLSNNDETLTMTDNRIMAHVQLAKTDTSNQPIGGMRFTLYKQIGDAPDLKDGSNGDSTITSFTLDAAGIWKSQTQTGVDNGDTGQKLNEGLAIGKYYFLETDATDSYYLPADMDGRVTPFEVTELQDKQTIERSAKNAPMTAGVTLKKVDAESKATGLAGAQFTLTRVKDGKGNEVTETAKTFSSEADGTVKAENLKKGHYTLKETGAPEGYDLGTEPFECEFDVTDAVQGKTLTIAENAANDSAFSLSVTKNKSAVIAEGVANIRKPASFTLEKIDSQNRSTKLSGAKFEIYTKTTKDFASDNGKKPVLTAETGKTYDCSQTNITGTDGTEGQLALNNLPWGDYWIIETVPPAGYQLPADNTAEAFTVGAATLDVKWVSDAAIKNDQNILTLKKTDMKGNALSGARLEITDNGGNKIGDTTLNTTADSWALTGALVAGETYNLKEIAVPAGYEDPAKLDENKAYLAQIQMDNTGNVIITDNNMTDGFITIGTDNRSIALKNQPIEVKLLKVDEGGKELDGARFNVKGIFGDTVQEIIIEGNNSAALYAKLIPGTEYTITEINAPDGYKKLPADVTFTVDTMGRVSLSKPEEVGGFADVSNNDTVVLKDDPVNIGFVKTNTEGVPIVGAELKIAGKFSNGDTERIITSTNDVIKVQNLIIGESYTLTENRPAYGYKLAEKPVEFKVENNGTVTIIKDEDSVAEITADGDIAFKNKAVTFGLIKTDMTGKELTGAEFVLTGKFADEPTVEKTITIAEPYSLDAKLIAGENYILKEKTAPEAYQLNERAVSFAVGNDGKCSLTNAEEVKAFASLTEDNTKVQFKDTLKLGDIVFTKRSVNDVDDAEKVPRNGVTFGLYSDQECKVPVMTKATDGKSVPVTAVSDESGTVRFKDIVVGVYFIKELTVANDVTQYYKTNSTLYKADVDGSKTGNTGEEYGITLADGTDIESAVINEAIRGSITLTKINNEFKTKDSSGNEIKLEIPLSGAEFAVCLKNTNKVVAAITENGITAGEYVLNPVNTITLGSGFTPAEDSNAFGIPYLYNNKLLAGQYDVFEVAAPVGYVKPESAVAEIYITEAENNVMQGQEVNSTITNVTRKQDIFLQKLVEVKNNDALQQTASAALPKAGFTFNLERIAEADGTTPPLFGYTDTQTTTGDNGMAKFSAVPVGKYRVTEIHSTETDYVIPDNYTQDIVVDNNGNVSYGEDRTSMVFENALKRGSVTGTKADISSNVTGEPGVAGATIGLYAKADDALNRALATAVTDADGTYTFKDIPYGTYIIKEKAVPQNSDYLLNETQKIEITVNDESLSDGIHRVSEKIHNTLPAGSFTLKKVDAITGAALEGVAFKLEGITSGGKAIASIENKLTGIDGNVTFDNIPVGKYTLTETATIASYQTPTETAKWAVKLTKDSAGAVKTEITGVAEKDNVFQITNKPIEGRIAFTKKDTDGRTLAGIGFTLTRTGDLIDPGKKVFSAVSGENGVVTFTDIPYGDYQLTEDITMGIQASMTPIEIQAKDLAVAEDGQSFTYDVNKGSVENELIKGSVSLTKVDQNGAVLAGVAFNVTRKGMSGNDGFELNPSANAAYTAYSANPQVQSDAKGVIALSGLPMGSYQLTENFEASTIMNSIATGQQPITVAFTIDENGQSNITPQEGKVYQEDHTWKIKNVLKFGTLQIDKVFGDQDSKSNPENTIRPNAVFDIFVDDGSEQPESDPVMTLSTSESGQFVSNADGSYTQGGRHQWLLEGNYLLKETASGSGNYGIDPEYHQFKIVENTIAAVDTPNSKIINNPYRGTLEITKFDEKYTIDADGNLVPVSADNHTQLNGAVFAVCLKEDTAKIVTMMEPKKNEAGEIETGVYVLPQHADGQTVETNTLGVPYLQNGQLLKGDYTVIEVVPPTGYEDKKTEKDIMIGTGENADIVDKIANALIEKPFVITKLAEVASKQRIEETGDFKAAAEGAFAFALTRDAGQTPEFAYSRTVKTDQNGRADFKDIPYGTYTLSEIETPDNYVPAVLGALKVDADGVHYSADNSNKTTDNLSVNNRLKRGNITGKKIDNTTTQDNLHGVEGAVMGLFAEDGKTKLAEATTVADGSYSFNNIPYGNYQIREITAPEGYHLSLETSAVEVRADGSTIVADTIHDTMIKGNFTLVKKDAEGEHKPLAGVAFTLEGSNCYGDSVKTTVVTGENGEAIFKDIPLGSYTLTETQKPENFTQFTPQSYSVTVVREKNNEVKTTLTLSDSTKALTPDMGTENTYSITNERNKGNIVFNKTGITGEPDDPGKPLGGVKFGLYRDEKCSVAVFDENNKPRTAISDEQGIVTFKDVSFGEYYVKEIGHVINYLPGAKAYKAVVNGDGSFNGLEDTKDNTVINVRNKGSVTLTKIDSEEPTYLLDGAEFTIYQNDKPVKTGITGKDGRLQIDGLLLGQEYRITETKAPVGHQLPDPEDPENSKLFTLVDDQTAESETAAQIKLDIGNWENKPNQGDISFTKYGTNDENNKGSKVVLPGVVFGLYKDLGATQEVQKTTSEEDGTVKFKNIYVGSYYVKEISTVTNYLKDETVYQAIIKEDGSFDGLYPIENNVMSSQSTDTVVNEAVRGSITINKTDSMDAAKKLSGIEFTLTKKDKDHKDVMIKTGVTDENGQLIFDDLLMDTLYTVTEKATLNTHILSTRQDSLTLRDTDEGRNRTINFTNDPTKLTFKKVDTTGAGLAGAEFTLYDGSQEKATATSDKDGMVTFLYLEKGKTYTVKETKRPGEDYLPSSTEFKAEVDKDGTCMLKNNDETVTEVVNADAGVITVNKTDADSKPLADTTFVLKNGNGEVIQTQTTGADGKLVFADVPMGSYTIVETAAPDPYAVSGDVTAVTLNRGANQKVSVSRVNTLSQVIFHKRGVITEGCAGNLQHAPLEGAVYGLYQDPECATEPVHTATSSNPGEGCRVIFTGVARGTWYVKEIEAPQYYTLDTTVYKAVVDGDGHFEGLTNLDDTKVADNRVVDAAVTTDIVLKKVNEQKPDEVLPDSTYGLFKKVAKTAPVQARAFSLFGRDNTPEVEDESEWQKIAEATTGQDGYLRFEGVLMGVEYSIRELKAPEGSHVSEKPVNIKFGVNDAGTPVIESIDLGLADPNDPNSAPTASVDPETGEIVWLEPSIVAEISKTDMNANLLAGAKLRITVKDENGAYVPLIREDGQPVEWISGDQPETFVKLMKIGKDYRLEEIEAPSGYKLAAPVDFIVKSPEQGVGPGENLSEQVVLKNELTSLFISKTTVNGTDELPGAVLTVYEAAEDGSIVRDEAGNEVVARTITGESLSWTSGTEMKKIEGLPAGAYVLREITAPDGYEVAEEITFTLMPGGAVTVSGEACEGNIVRMQDKPAPETVTPGVPDKPQTSTPNNPEISGGADTGIAGLVSPATFWGVMALLSVTALLVCSVVVWRRKRW
ncbi:MAG: hypothetical protein EUB_00593 [Eubacterium sp.]|uniref:SpaA isopeptide-forming pilin-related protein n=1 Tax=Eubacterium sp. TaxID=142586 RepID=UPI00303B6148